MSSSNYDPMLCPRCKQAIKHINEPHMNLNMFPCKANKIAKGAYVYLLHDVTNDLLKIGYSQNPTRRHKEFVHSTTNQINLIGYFPGSRTNENLVHIRFKKAQIKREWFENDEEITNYFTNHPEFKGLDIFTET